MKRRTMKLPPIPNKMQPPDGDALRMLALCVTTPEGRKQAHQMANYLERVIEVNHHNEQVAREALRQLREALQEVEA